ncbi:Spy/CpxP family protein refolding chaperone [Fluoribacter dumoffii]|uniref:Spy/CpxP family protein refolding chaperone n=1 Tax=Fluoribacter dumoffii TaxID=463 RepID=UPI00026C7A39|nr:Spy/CpxP family protein refolding chaperone [Fluoribacter dumoffii]
MNNKILLLPTLILAVILVQPSSACVGDINQCKLQHQFDRLAQELNLSANQKAKIRAYKEQSDASFKDNYAQLRLLGSEMSALTQADILDQKMLDSLIEKVNIIRGSMLKNKIIMQHHIYALLDEKQKIQFIEFKKNWVIHHSE